MTDPAHSAKHVITQREAAIRARFNLVGVLFLVIGLPLAILIYVKAPSTAVDSASGYMVNTGPTKEDEYQMERIGGKANVMGAEVTAWYDSLWHGRTLGDTIAFLSLGGAMVCFFFGHFIVFHESLDK